MDAAIILTMVITTDAEAGFGLLSSYSSVADVAVTIMVVAVLAYLVIVAAVVAAMTMVIAVNGLSFFLFSSSVAETTVPAANSYRRRHLRRLLT